MTSRGEQLDAAAARLGPLARSEVSLAPLCTYKVGGNASLFVNATSVADLEVVAEALVETSIQTLVVGKGSNILVSDAGFDGVVVQLGDAFSEIAIDTQSGLVRLGAATLLPVAARMTAAAGLTGFEWAVGVPGSVGGAVRMNAGGHGSDIAANLVRVSRFDLYEGGPVEVKADQLDLTYRHSSVAANHLVLFAELELESGDRKRSEAEISEIVRWRRANQPGGQNAGSVFTNPPGDSAGRLIDSAGLKGLRVGTAEVSTKHANFIQADPGGSGDDVRALIETVKTRVAEAHGVDLHCENLLIGFDETRESPTYPAQVPPAKATASPSASSQRGDVKDVADG